MILTLSKIEKKIKHKKPVNTKSESFGFGKNFTIL